jgi:hypothetical protein
MQRILFVLAAAFATAAFAVPAAFAGNGHFIANATECLAERCEPRLQFQGGGLESGSVETISCAGNEVVTYECVNGGGKNPSASNKTSVTGPLNKMGTFTAAKNGNVVGSLTVSPLTAAEVGFTCPSGQTVTFVSVCVGAAANRRGDGHSGSGALHISVPGKALSQRYGASSRWERRKNRP